MICDWGHMGTLPRPLSFKERGAEGGVSFYGGRGMSSNEKVLHTIS